MGVGGGPEALLLALVPMVPGGSRPPASSSTLDSGTHSASGYMRPATGAPARLRVQCDGMHPAESGKPATSKSPANSSGLRDALGSRLATPPTSMNMSWSASATKLLPKRATGRSGIATQFLPSPLLLHHTSRLGSSEPSGCTYAPPTMHSAEHAGCRVVSKGNGISSDGGGAGVV